MATSPCGNFDFQMIDTHAHVFHRGLRFVPQRRYTPDYDAWPATYLRLLDQHHVQGGVLVPVSILGSDNRFVIETVRASGGRLKGLVTLDPAAGAVQVGDFANQGMCGFRLNLADGQQLDLRGGAWPEILQECSQHGWIAEINAGASRLSQTLPQLLDTGLRVVVDHFGQPDKTLGTADPGFQYLLSLGHSKRVWVKLSAPYRLGDDHAARAARLLLRSYGPAQLLWASDWPFTGFESSGIDYGATCNFLKDWIPEDDVRHEIAQRSPAELFGFVTAGVVA